MFTEFLLLLRTHGIKVSLTEWMTLQEGLKLGHGEQSLMGFYELCRMICIKSESAFDVYDQCFAAYFHNIPPTFQFNDELEKWLAEPIIPRNLSEEERRQIESLDFDELMQRFAERLKEQKERHDGGSKWIGTGGTSPFGHSGYHPSGIRVGGQSRNRMAIKVASQREFQNLRHDVTLDTRQISLALRKLRLLARDVGHEDLDLDGTIRKTGDEGGDISLVFRRTPRNSVKVLLLMDVGGSMTAHAELSSQLFSAAHSSHHFREFRHFYFHNCPYETLFTDIARREGVSTLETLRNLDDSWYLIVVGDAAMNPYELLIPGGSVDWFHHNETPGVEWLNRLKTKIPRAIWLNPEPESFWGIQSTAIVRKIFPMFPMTLNGLDQGIACLRTGR